MLKIYVNVANTLEYFLSLRSYFQSSISVLWNDKTSFQKLNDRRWYLSISSDKPGGHIKNNISRPCKSNVFIWCDLKFARSLSIFEVLYRVAVPSPWAIISDCLCRWLTCALIMNTARLCETLGHASGSFIRRNTQKINHHKCFLYCNVLHPRANFVHFCVFNWKLHWIVLISEHSTVKHASLG